MGEDEDKKKETKPRPDVVPAAGSKEPDQEIKIGKGKGGKR